MENTTNLFTIPSKEHDETRQGEAFGANPTEQTLKTTAPNAKKFYVESYGCALNFNDSEIVATLLNEDGYGITTNYKEADLILINTCSIRENAETKVRERLRQFKAVKKTRPETLIGVLGCMAERLKEKLLEQEQMVDLIVGPDAYRSLTGLIQEAASGHKAVNVLLSREETYADISPTRLAGNGINGFVTIARGCNNMCSFCVVPYTRGRERSRDAHTIVAEATMLFNEGFRDITLLGQNVDSYHWKQEAENSEEVNFAKLLGMVAAISPLLRVRFSTSHPKDITDEVLYAMLAHENICKQIHLPVQSGNSEVLERMNRTYNREWYLEKFNRIKELIPACAVSTDIITGFCGETDEQHADTISMINYCKFDFSYHFKYSERGGTPAAKKFADDVAESVKQARLDEIINLCRFYAHEKNKATVGNTYKILVEGPSHKKNVEGQSCGRNTQNQMIVFPTAHAQKGDYVNVKVLSTTTGTLIGEIV
jgi:tRNA-2-methylthio-N6-dimethylallyladenosine synthase